MMGSNAVLNIFTANGFITIIEILIIILELVYVLYAFILSRQVSLMNNSFKTPYSASFRMIALLHLMASVALVLFSIMVLLL